MAANKTIETENNATDFINTVKDETQRSDSFQLIEIFKNQTGFDAKMWGQVSLDLGAVIINMQAVVKETCH